MGKIVLLDELTINQIAAGEVIERPASVVKEMVENSIDAGAKSISIEIKKGGIELIKITDDGCGIAEDDMEIAFERHATSKIRSSNDLEVVKTMGFRGEALASIAAIAKVEMVSKTSDSEIGHKIVVEGGEIKEKAEIGCQRGTTISVENLFYNTPVRYKFLRKDYTEAGYIEDAVTRIALVNKNVAIKLINSGKTVLQTSGNNDIKSVVYSIYGKDTANGIIETSYSFEDIKVTGIVGKPEIARGNRGYQQFFVNGRFVKDKTLTAAADGAFKDILPVGKYGFLVLNIEMDPRKVDVNVHPAKLEVRFENESEIYKAVYHAIKSVLDQNNVKKVDSQREFSFEEKKNFEPVFSKSVFLSETTNSFNTHELNLEKENVATERKENILKNEVPERSVVEENKEEAILTNSYKDLQPEEDFVKPKIRTGISEFFKKVKKNNENTRKEYVEENLVEALFKERNGQKRTTPDFVEKNISNEEAEFKPSIVEKKEEKIEEKEEPKAIFNENFTLVKESIDDVDKMPHESIDYKEVKREEFENFKFGKKDKLEEEKNINLEHTLTNNNENLQTEHISETLEKLEEPKDDENNIVENNVVEPYSELDINSKSIKFGNVSISSDTAEIPININEVIKDEKEYNKEIFNEEKVEEKIEANTEEKLEESNNNVDDSNDTYELTDSIVKNKISNLVEPTQILDMNRIRENIQNVGSKETPEVTPEFAEMYKKTFGKDISKKPEEKNDNLETYNDFLYNTENENINVFEEKNSFIPERKYRFIGNVFDCYLLIEMGNSMYIIDQRLAYEKIIYEKIKENYYDESKKDSVFLLLPDIVSLNKKELSIANENIEMFERAGFGFEEFGENTLKLYAVPSLCEKLNTKQLFLDILDSLNSVSIISREEKEEKFISTIAYKSAIKAKINLDENEIIEVLDQLFTLENPFVCADSKQIAIKMTKIDFEKKFSRR